jgi:hypothetical protein
VQADVAQDDDAWLLVPDAMIFRTEAEVRWLDHMETRLTSRRKPAAKPNRARVR